LFTNSLGSALKGIIDNAPLPQFLKDGAKGVIDDVLGSNQQATTPEAQDAVSEQYGDIMQTAAENMAQDAADEADAETRKSGGGNWLIALAKALGETAGEHLESMVELSEKIGDIKGSGKSDKAQAKEMADLQAQFQAESQMFKMVSEATSTAVKSIGEGLSSMARKQ